MAQWFPVHGDCDKGVESIDTSKTYKDGDEFSHGICMIQYRTNGNGDQEISGQDIADTIAPILEDCPESIGSRGTGNCDDCHVTVNYRD